MKGSGFCQTEPNGERESGMGLPHSTTLARLLACRYLREVLECGRPMPL
jgi:hypothetical protein